MTPTSKASRISADTNSVEPGVKFPASALKTTAEIAVVGPETITSEEPKSAAMIGGIIAV